MRITSVCCYHIKRQPLLSRLLWRETAGGETLPGGARKYFASEERAQHSSRSAAKGRLIASAAGLVHGNRKRRKLIFMVHRACNSCPSYQQIMLFLATSLMKAGEAASTRAIK